MDHLHVRYINLYLSYCCLHYLIKNTLGTILGYLMVSFGDCTTETLRYWPCKQALITLCYRTRYTVSEKYLALVDKLHDVEGLPGGRAGFHVSLFPTKYYFPCVPLFPAKSFPLILVFPVPSFIFLMFPCVAMIPETPGRASMTDLSQVLWVN